MTEEERVKKVVDVLRNRNKIHCMIERLAESGGYENVRKILELAINKLDKSPPDIYGAIQDMNLVNLLVDSDNA